jgi:O-methyltransferase
VRGVADRGIGAGAAARMRDRASAVGRATLRNILPPELQAPAPGLARRLVARTGYFRARTRLAAHGDRIPDAALYQPLYSPWLGDPDFERVYAVAAPRTLVSRDRCYVLWRTLQPALHLDGAVVECGVFRGGTALLAATTVRDRVGGRPVHLVDSFAGMPPTTEDVDRLREGDLDSTSAEDVRRALAPFPFVHVHEGFIPEVLDEIGADRVAWAHIAVDIYAAVRDCLEHLYPRVIPGGVIVLDDYAFPSCPGARRAVDEFFSNDRPEVVLCLPTGQGLVTKLP